MSDLISRSALIEEVQKCFVNNSIHKNDLAEVIAKLPTVEAKPVVHCKDCTMLQDCRFSQYLGLEGYCSRGEKHD